MLNDAIKNDARSGDVTEDRSSVRAMLELACVFLLFAAVMHFIYLGPRGIAFHDRGVPGHDSFYHIKMAALMPELGLVDQFPWLRTTVFAERFVNHHYGFQWLLYPFVRVAERLTGDMAAGGRWFITVSFGLSMALVQWLLMLGRVRHRWVWLGLLLLLPIQFYGRHMFVRAINPSLIGMLILCGCMMARCYALAGIVIAQTIHVYLGAVVYGPVIVAAFCVAELFDRPGSLPLESSAWFKNAVVRRLLLWTVSGWIVGLATHPYGAVEVLRFLDLQVLGTGLSPDISVGREWKSYTPAWFFVSMSGVTLTVSAVSLCLRLRWGPRLSANEFAFVLLNVLFLVLTLKARRFIEYWPVFAMIGSAYLFAGLPVERRRSVGNGSLAAAIALLVLVFCVAMLVLPRYRAGEFLGDWLFWSVVAGLAAAPTLCCVATGFARSRAGRGLVSAAVGVGFCVLVAIALKVLSLSAGDPVEARLVWGVWLIPFVGLVYFAFGAIGRNASAGEAGDVRFKAVAVRRVTVALAVVVALAPPVGTILSRLQKDAKCLYDLPALRALMAVLIEDSDEGDVVFTDDWDVFPVYFYLNHHNHYVVGLDPKFTHERDPELWERYVRISRGQTPVTKTVKVMEDGHSVEKKVTVHLSDIRSQFDARYVIVDADHHALSGKLDRRGDLAERIFPEEIGKGEKPPYRLYRIKDAVVD